MHRVDPGFDPENVLTMDVPNQGRSLDQRRAFYAAALEQIERHPDVRSAAIAMTVPLRGSPMVHDFRIDGKEITAGNAPQADFKSVSPGYFGTVGVPLLRGRTFTNLDHENAPPVVVINESMAEFYFPNEDPVGRRIAWDMGGAMGGPGEWRTIVGVVADSKEYGLDRGVVHGVFQPFAQEPFAATVLIRTTSNPTQLIPQAVQAIRELAPNQPVDNIRTLLQLRSDSIAPRRLNATLFGAFALLALVIAAVGVSGVLAFSVSQRTHEFGIRLTLGADQNRVLGMVLREGATLAAVGLGIGVVGALSLSRFLSGLLFDVQTTDPLTFVGVGVGLVGVAILALYIPARRAARVDPVEALRSE